MSAVKRIDIRHLKRAVTREHSAEAMLCLLQRSVRFGHKKLALLRCLQAERLGILVEADVLAYCQCVADSLPEPILHKLLQQAARIEKIG